MNIPSCVGAGLPEMVTNYLSGKPIKPALWCHAQVPKNTKIVGAGLPEMVTNYLSGKPIKPALWCHSQVSKGGFYIKLSCYCHIIAKPAPTEYGWGLGYQAMNRPQNHV